MILSLLEDHAKNGVERDLQKLFAAPSVGKGEWMFPQSILSFHFLIRVIAKLHFLWLNVLAWLQVSPSAALYLLRVFTHSFIRKQ